jgi:hypothetical protein
MATWQCDFFLVPESWLAANHFLVDRLPEDVIAEESWWVYESLSEDYISQLDRFVRSTVSWSQNIELYGGQDGNCVEIVRSKGHVVSLFARIDLRQFDSTFAEGLLAFAQSQKCSLVTFDGRIVVSEIRQLIVALKDSRAFRFVSDPFAYFEVLNAHPIELS